MAQQHIGVKFASPSLLLNLLLSSTHFARATRSIHVVYLLGVHTVQMALDMIELKKYTGHIVQWR